MEDAEAPVERPIADVAPRPITMEQYLALTPEKIELWQGYLISGPDDPEERRNLLALLLVNEGLRQAVRLATPERWQAALREVYGEP